MESPVDLQAIAELMWLEDDEFENAVRDLDLKEILCLMESLQTSMCEEQLQFEDLTRQLQTYPDRSCYNHRKISAALCTVQSLLTNLCTKHMICSGQRSLRSSFNDDLPSVGNTPIVEAHIMSSNSFHNVCDRKSGFKESLKFFQSQVDKLDVSQLNGTKNDTRKKILTNGHIKNHSSLNEVLDTKSNLKINTSAPSVDNILTNVKQLCSNRSVTDLNSNSTITQQIVSNRNNKVTSNMEHHTYQSSYNRVTKHELGVTKSEQVDSVPQKATLETHSLLSNFNPSLEFDNTTLSDTKSNNVEHSTSLDSSKMNLKSQTLNNSKKSLEKPANCHSPNSFHFGTINNDSASKTVSDSADGKTTKASNLFTKESTEVTDDANAIGQVPRSRTFGQCKEKLSQVELTKVSPLRKPQAEQQNLNTKTKTTSSENSIDASQKEDSSLEKRSDSFESEYDSQDFIVHKTNFPDDYLEVMSEDNYSSVNEEYEVEHPPDPEIPSPDYVSDEEEFLVRHNEQYEDEFVDNSAQYAADTDNRRYFYYQDEKELEVIPEEDEDDIEEDMFNKNEIYKRGSFPTSNPSSEDSRYNNHGECDSGLTDDQRSSCSTTEECDIEDDTDSAKGSLPLHDSSTESPTYNERPNMFQNVEYHKLNKKIYPTKRVIEDYEKPMLKGKNVEALTNLEQNSTGAEDLRQVRTVTSSWDPRELLEILYRLDTSNEQTGKKPNKYNYINKEGNLEKLPSGRRKATYWNPWKTKYIKLKDGFLLCFDNIRSEKPSMTMQLMGGHIDTLDNKMLGVDDQKGHYLVLRSSNDDESESWEHALRSQCAEDFVTAYTSPCPRPLSITEKVVIIDMGSCSVRAGILMSQPTLPKLFFPTVCASSRTSLKKYFGIDALKPSVRKDCQISFPLHPSPTVTKYSVDVSVLPDLLKHIFKELNVYPEDYKVQLSMPRNLSLQTKIKIAHILLDEFRVKGVNLTHQAILSLHAYNSKSGIIVDIGDRLDVIPIIEGYIVESGVTRLPYGGQRMIHHLKHALAEKNISIVSDVETYLARYVLEQLCYVAEDYNEESQQYHTNPDDFEMSISTNHFFKENCPWNEIILDMGRFHVPEGLFTPEKWGLDNPGLHKLVYHAIQECGVDLRREMTRSIYISGGVTLLPGFVERLEDEIDKLTPNTITPKVHASEYRYHMSYIGACQIALEEKFDEICITKQIWRKEGNTCVKKWHI